MCGWGHVCGCEYVLVCVCLFISVYVCVCVSHFMEVVHHFFERRTVYVTIFSFPALRAAIFHLRGLTHNVLCFMYPDNGMAANSLDLLCAHRC